jgi:hypothetical protein
MDTDRLSKQSVETPLRFMSDQHPVTHEYLMAAIAGNAALRATGAHGRKGSHALFIGGTTAMEYLVLETKKFGYHKFSFAELSPAEDAHYLGV